MQSTQRPESIWIRSAMKLTGEALLSLLAPLPFIFLLRLLGVPLLPLLLWCYLLPSLLLLLLLLSIVRDAISRSGGNPDASMQPLPGTAESGRRD